MRILGLSAYYHDSAAALLVDGRPVAAAQEERFTRVKHDSGFPAQATAYCLQAGGIAAKEIDAVAFYDKPFLKFERLLETYLAFAPRGFASFRKAMPVWIREKLFLKGLIAKELKALDPEVDWTAKLLFAEHHMSHAASAFYPSPFEDAVVLTMDGVGEWATGSAALGDGAELDIFQEMHFPHSLGLLYSAFTYYLGFKVNSGEYKVMGLAPYGEPVYADKILDTLIDLKPDGSFRLDQAYFDYCTGLTMTNARFDALFGRPPRTPEQDLEPFHMDVAASVQAVTEEVMLRLTRSLAKETGRRNLCLAGGVALNCVANGKVLRDGSFERIWIQPAAGDAGGSLGAAYLTHHKFHGRPRQRTNSDAMSGAYLGPAFEQAEIERRLREAGAVFEVLDEAALLDAASADLADGKALGWFQGRMEFGPRALGNRSIVADPRSPEMQKTLNLKVKFRESFRPFAPAVREEDCAEWFDLEGTSPYMLLVAEVAERHRIAESAADRALFGIDRLNKPRSAVPAVTHVDHSARIQTVSGETNPRFHALLGRFKTRTGCPILVNTSFNVRGEPIVHTPEDAFRCFMGSGIERLAVGNCWLRKEEQTAESTADYRERFALD